MSQEVFEIVQRMDFKDIGTQLAFQCAPLIAGLKISNLLIIQYEDFRKVRQILKNSGISYSILTVKGQKATILLYNKRELEEYLANKKVSALLERMGYRENTLEEVLSVFRSRYVRYMEEGWEFPHEMGVLLGYPAEDVEGFIRNGGDHFLYAGYWKVYEDLSAKMQLFRRFEAAEKALLEMVSSGVSIAEIVRARRPADGVC